MIERPKRKKYAGLDWAMKKLLRSKTNFGILEGFLSELLNEDIKIDHLLESESNKVIEEDKHNRVDMLVKDSKGEIIIIEVQYTRELDYFHRMLYGASKIISEYMQESFPYEKVSKVISVNLVYFGLGQGEDYIYEGRTKFEGRNKHDQLKLTPKQKKIYKKEEVFGIYPEYYLIKINNFNDVAKTTLDEWIYFLKNEDIKKGFTAKGLKEASEKLNIMKFDEKKRSSYNAYIEHNRYKKSTLLSSFKDGMYDGMEKGMKEGMKKGREEGIKEGMEKAMLKLAKKLKLQGMNNDKIVELTGLSKDCVSKL